MNFGFIPKVVLGINEDIVPVNAAEKTGEVSYLIVIQIVKRRPSPKVKISIPISTKFSFLIWIGSILYAKKGISPVNEYHPREGDTI